MNTNSNESSKPIDSTKSTKPHVSKTKDSDIYFEKYRKKSGKERAKMQRYPKWDKRIEVIKETNRKKTLDKQSQ